jgi:hypothetical protein
VEMAGLWKAWKAKGRLTPLSTSPLEISPSTGEIPTFPQLRRVLVVSERRASKELRSVGRGKVEIQEQDSHFSTAPRACDSKEEGILLRTPKVLERHPSGTYLKRFSGGAPRRVQGQGVIVVDAEL